MSSITVKTIAQIMDDAARNGHAIVRTKSAMLWLGDKAKSLGKMNASTFIREEGHKFVGKNNIGIGKMYFFMYDAKWKNKLPYWDRFPCVFIFHIKGNRSWGLNLHYLAYRERALLLDELLKLENNPKIPENKRLKLTYGIIKSFAQSPLAMPCIKSYLNNHIKSRFIVVPPEEWPVAAFLPVQTFDSTKGKVTSRQVWNDSRRRAKKIQRNSRSR